MKSLPWAPPSYATRLVTGLVLSAFADFLFFEQPAGISLPVFAFALAMAVTAVHPAAPRQGGFPLKAAGLGLALLPLAENASLLSFSVALVALVLFALSIAERLRRGLARLAGQLGLFFLAMPFRFLRDVFRWRKAARRSGARTIRPVVAVAMWAMPLALGAIFLALFGVANPVIEHWLSLIDLWALLELVQPARVAFWLLVLIAAWAFLRPRLPRFFRRRHAALPPSPTAPAGVPPRTRPTIKAAIFGRGAILRSLLTFNLLFAVQTVLDLAYLWGGIALPEGMTYAAYAHRGAYPLIVTALLAAAFVLLSMRPGSETSGDRLIRSLVYLWVGQNVALVVSSILRLDLYVEVYSLTYWRVAAFIWMGLVAAGLLWIVARISLEKSNQWLFSANLLTLSATLYMSCFMNFAALIADYNVRHSLEMTGRGTPLDICYLRSLGPDAFPAVDQLLHRLPSHGGIATWRAEDEAVWRATQTNWRAWSFRDWRLLRYLDSRPPAVPLYP